MKRLIAYLFIVLGLGLIFNNYSIAPFIVLITKLMKDYQILSPIILRENEFFYFSAQSGTCLGSYTQVTFEQYNYFKNLFDRKIKIAKKKLSQTKKISYKFCVTRNLPIMGQTLQ